MVLRLEIQSTSFKGYQHGDTWGYGCGDTGDTAGNTCYRVQGVMDVVIQVTQLEIHPTSYRGYARGDTGDTKLQ